MGDFASYTVNILKGFLLPVILFVCTANQFRSPIAAACFSRKLTAMGTEGDWTVISAGTWASAGLPAHPKAVEAAEKIGLDLKSHQTREVTTALLRVADVIVVMQANHKEALEAEFPFVRGRIFLLGSLANIPGDEIPDPASDNFAQPETSAHLINVCIDKAFAILVQFVLLRQKSPKK